MSVRRMMASRTRKPGWMQRAALGAAALAAMAGVARAQSPSQQKLALALYAPTAPFDSPAARVDYIDRLAQQVQQQTGIPTTGIAFARASDFSAAVGRHGVDFAVLDPQFVAEHLKEFPVLAAATINGATSQSWSLFAADAGVHLPDLAGKRLAVVSVGGHDAAFIENALLEGEVSIAKYFAPKPVTAADVASAVQAVSLRRADVVLVPSSLGGSLNAVFEIPGLPSPAFVRVNPRLSADLVDKVKAAVLSYGGVGGGLGGWRASGPGPYADLAARMNARVKPVVYLPPDVVRLDAGAVLQPLSLELPLPELGDQLWTPALPKPPRHGD